MIRTNPIQLLSEALHLGSIEKKNLFLINTNLYIHNFPIILIYNTNIKKKKRET